MSKRYVPNDTAAAIFVGGVMIPPGEGREIDELFLPPEGAQAAPDEPPPSDPDANLRELLKQPVKDVLPQLEAFSTDTLDALARLESEAGTPRKTLLAAIAELKLDRAKRAAEGGDGSEGGED